MKNMKKVLAVLALSLAAAMFTVTGTAYGEGYIAVDRLWIKAVINTDEGPLEAVFHKGGENLTERGDTVVWGYFYADPADVSWGHEDNPDLYVKIWYDVTGRIDVNFFHVSMPSIEVYTDYPYDGTYDKSGTATTDDRYIRHEYYAAFPPSCIADLNNWKVDFQPQNSDCMKCHTTCTPASRHTFCDEGESWEVSESKCLNCHGSDHSE